MTAFNPDFMSENINIPAGNSLKMLLVSTSNGIVLPFGKNVCGFDVLTDNVFDCRMTVGSGASVEFLAMALPGADFRMNLRVELAGTEAGFRFGGLYLCPDAENADMDIEVFHKVPGCSSRQMLRGIVSGTAKAKFHGRIIVEPDAQKTEAYQENHNLLLSEDAKVETDPQLEIYADDVKCSHGAAIGKLDENEQFYMRSRGIPEQEAKVLQMQSFVSPVFEFLPECGEREKIAAWIEHTIRNSF